MRLPRRLPRGFFIAGPSLVLLALLSLASLSVAQAQTGANWRKVGSSAVELMLASPATGPVDRVWFSGDGELFARTRSGKVFHTVDFETWASAAALTGSAVEPAEPMAGQPVRLPEPGARVIAMPRSRLYAMG